MPQPSLQHRRPSRPSRAIGRRSFLTAALASVLATLLMAPAAPAQAKVLPSALVEAKTLKPLVDKKAVVVLDTREIFQTDGKTPNFTAGHIPGALPAPYSSFRGPDSNPGQVKPLAALEAQLGALGLGLNTPVVIAGSGSDPTEFGGPARIYWTLKQLGFADVAILNGGTGAWIGAGYALQTGEAAPRKATTLKARPSPALRYSTQDLAQATQKGKAGVGPMLLDGRPYDFYSGDLRLAAAPRWGTLPGAKHLETDEWFVGGTGTLQAADRLRALAQNEQLLGKEPLVSFCNSGHWAATHWFVLSEVLGRPNVTLYPESVVAWGAAGLPLENEPSRAEILSRQLRGAGIQK